ncbi:30S ribosomal protein S12 methylthiotransferase RimO [Peptoniphilus catoniae]|uniref:30S ribosomal protein S12 methylthiotransferase RimO n=1 Tax=Peptoniphilus catoniae TaxID=1660341 RepID=UPI0010FD138D|nr:30S ribosomal protein S12 methylthiotransferase RimO [Peptoniphilus catoniae]
MNKVYFMTLGCSKNDIDTSQMKSILDENKFDISDDIECADVIVVNTCGFIDAAKEESIDAILSSSRYKETGKCKKLIVTGCLAQRYSKELLEEIPEIDSIIGTGNFGDINNILDTSLKGKKTIEIDNLNNKYIEGLKKKDVFATEYVKISEGCNNNCTYCIIPKLRGSNRSRKIEDIYDEVEYLVSKGAKEIILIAQNTTDYGIDIYGEYKLADLIAKISKIKDLEWIRVMYLYPDNLNTRLINEFKTNDKLLKYVDIPLQHVSNKILKMMNRHTDRQSIQNLINKLRKEITNIVIRTTFIVGFPGESEEDFMELYNFIKDNKLDKLGVFKYSKEENTPAYNLKNHLSDEIKEDRYERIMSLQKDISEDNIKNYIGKTLDVLVEEKVDDFNYIGRAYCDAPEVDGVIYLNTNKNICISDFVKVQVIDSFEYDLIGELL